MTGNRFRLLTPALGLALVACADFGGPIDSSGQLTPREQRLQSIEQKLASLDDRIESVSAVDLASKLTRIEEDVRELRGDIETLRHDVDTNERRARELYLDLDRRIQQVEEGGTRVSGPGAGPGSNGATAAAGGSRTSDPEERQAYLDAFELLQAQKIEQSIGQFESMLEKWPNGQYADNGTYWIGEAHYVNQQFDKAISKFQSLIKTFPNSNKVPDALLKIGFSQQELGRTAEARDALQRIVDQHPQSAAAQLAKPRLDKLKRDNRGS